jgi:hypothetical protein
MKFQEVVNRGSFSSNIGGNNHGNFEQKIGESWSNCWETSLKQQIIMAIGQKLH